MSPSEPSPAEIYEQFLAPGSFARWVPLRLEPMHANLAIARGVSLRRGIIDQDGGRWHGGLRA